LNITSGGENFKNSARCHRFKENPEIRLKWGALSLGLEFHLH